MLRHFRKERGLEPGTKNGPRHFAWFPTVVGDHFRQRREREEAANPREWAQTRGRVGQLEKARFDKLLDAIELPDAGGTIQ